MSSGAKSFAGLFGMTDFMMPMVLGDLSEEQAYARPRGEGGPSIAWTVGHILHYRVFMLNRFGQEVENEFEERFGNVPATDGADYPPLAELQRLWDEVSSDFLAAVSDLTDEELDAQLDEGWHEEQALRDQVVFFAWHEGYHMGALGQIRKELGLPGPAERVMEMRRAEAAMADGASAD